MDIFKILIILVFQSFVLSFQFDELIAKELAAFSFLTYFNNDDDIKQNNCGIPCRRHIFQLQDIQIIYNYQYNTKVILGYSALHQGIIIAFRGSQSQNWFQNIQFLLKEYSYCKCKIHKGFLKTYQSIQADLAEAFKKLKSIYPFPKIYVTGHSLGGVLATLSIPLIYELNFYQKIDYLYTFGQPKIGTKDFTDWFDGQNFIRQVAKIYMSSDIIRNQPNIPFIKYQNTKYIVLYDSFDNPQAEMTKCYLPQDFSCQQNSYSIADHQSYYGWDWKNLRD